MFKDSDHYHLFFAICYWAVKDWSKILKQYLINLIKLAVEYVKLIGLMNFAALRFEVHSTLFMTLNWIMGHRCVKFRVSFQHLGIMACNVHWQYQNTMSIGLTTTYIPNRCWFTFIMIRQMPCWYAQDTDGYNYQIFDNTLLMIIPNFCYQSKVERVSVKRRHIKYVR